MEASGTHQDLTLQQFLFDLATHPHLQLKLASIYKDTLHKFLVEQGLSGEDAQLLADAQFSDEGKKKLAQRLTRHCKDPWTCSMNTVMDE